MILALMDHLTEIIDANRLDKTMIRTMMQAIPVDISEQRFITVYDAYENHLWFSSHPEDTIEARWGLKKCDMIYTQTRATKDSIAFIEKTYRKKDPRYADFSLREQQHVLQKLKLEWARFACTEPAPAPKKKGWLWPFQKASTNGPAPLKKCEAIRKETRATKDSISFIEKTYRKSDPAYADYSIRIQKDLLQRLDDEWSGSGCR